MALDPKNELSVRRWRAAGRITLAVLLAFSTLQYYFFEVQLQILAMPGLIVVTPTAARTHCSAGNRDQSAAPGTPLPCG